MSPPVVPALHSHPVGMPDRAVEQAASIEYEQYSNQSPVASSGGRESYLQLSPPTQPAVGAAADGLAGRHQGRHLESAKSAGVETAARGATGARGRRSRAGRRVGSPGDRRRRARVGIPADRRSTVAVGVGHSARRANQGAASPNVQTAANADDRYARPRALLPSAMPRRPPKRRCPRCRPTRASPDRRSRSTCRRKAPKSPLRRCRGRCPSRIEPPPPRAGSTRLLPLRPSARSGSPAEIRRRECPRDTSHSAAVHWPHVGLDADRCHCRGRTGASPPNVGRSRQEAIGSPPPARVQAAGSGQAAAGNPRASCRVAALRRVSHAAHATHRHHARRNGKVHQGPQRRNRARRRKPGRARRSRTATAKSNSRSRKRLPSWSTSSTGSATSSGTPRWKSSPAG